MIGIALKLYNVLVITEFFELFKTPWEFFKPDRIYEVIITDETQLDQFEAKLVIAIHRESGSILERNQNKLYGQPILVRYEEITFPIYTVIKKIVGSSPLILVEKTGECIGGSCCNSNKTILHIGYDFFEEAGYLITNGQPPEYAYFPTLDIHINNLRNWILEAGALLIEIPPIANGSKFFACLTHDVDFSGIRNHKFDHTMFGFVYRALFKSVSQYFQGQYSLKMLARNWMAVVKLPFIYLGVLRDFWTTFKQYREIEADAQSTFFFVPFQDKAGKLENGHAPLIRAVKYDVANLKQDILYLINQGCEIGVHGIDSWIDIENGKKEIDKIRYLTGQSMLGVRMHWLYFRADSPEKLEKAGYTFDSTCGYNDKIGYRAGTAQIYRPIGAKHLLELPMHIMDTALFYPDRMRLNFSEGINEIKSFVERAVRFGGVLTFNWHDRSVAPERLWDGVYRCVLHELKVQGARFLTAGAVIEWFRKRRDVVFDQVDSNSSPIRIKLTRLDMSPIDGMVLRIYSHYKCSSHRQPDKSTMLAYTDYLLGEQKEVEILL